MYESELLFLHRQYRSSGIQMQPIYNDKRPYEDRVEQLRSQLYCFRGQLTHDYYVQAGHELNRLRVAESNSQQSC
eukprot:CAMPEP_0172383336 /NCGR_PEP_ID=MMETSP1061-20121228/1230_1 /TAXON_ID=37318 /ORGANISM="Pseudo-nitzschia pungens, Strain cf. pungens" /LENGTH=74 /DNA_ID=CAMNT_0013111543 /DNA_START=281 /DNA_END=502 /DNA_ORIENTATION=-